MQVSYRETFFFFTPPLLSNLLWGFYKSKLAWSGGLFKEEQDTVSFK